MANIHVENTVSHGHGWKVFALVLFKFVDRYLQTSMGQEIMFCKKVGSQALCFKSHNSDVFHDYSRVGNTSA